MKNWLKVLNSLILCLALGLSFNSHAKEVVNSGTPASDNLLEIRDFLYFIESIPDAGRIAIAIMAQLQLNKIYWHSEKDLLGNWNHPGQTWRDLDQAFREDFLQPNHRFTFLGNNLRDFRKGVKLMIVLSHEMNHYFDYSTAPFSSSPELRTYERGYQFMIDIYGYLIEQLKRAPANEKALWANRLIAYSEEVRRELASYLVEEYGELTISFNPFFDHGGCVRPLTRRDIIQYMYAFERALRRNTEWSEALDSFDVQMKYTYPAEIGNHCRMQTPEAGELSNRLAAGYSGPRNRLTLYEFQINGSHQAVLRKNENDDQVAYHFTEPVDGTPIGLVSKGTVYSWHRSGSANYDRPGRKILVVDEGKESNQPISYGFTLTGRYTNADGERVEYNISSRQLSIQETQAYGYYPIGRKVHNLIFSRNSLSGPQHFNRQEIIELEAQSGDYLRFIVPKVDDRAGTLYKVEERVGELPTLNLVATLYSWHEQLDRRIETDEAGKYLFIISRPDRIEANRTIPVTVQISRKGRVSPSQFQSKVLNRQESASYGFHAPSQESATVHYRNTQSDNFFGSFRFQSFLDLDVMRGDRIKFSDLGAGTGRSIEVVKVNESGGLDHFQRIYSWYDRSEIIINDDSKYLMIFANDEEFAENHSASISFRRWRYSLQGPTEAQLHWLSLNEVAQYGYYPIATHDFEGELTTENPKSLIYENRHYQLYEFSVENKARFLLKSPNPGIERRFVLFKVDEERFAQARASLQDAGRSFLWYDEMDKTVEVGRYVIALEADDADMVGSAPFRLHLSMKSQDPSTVNIRKMTPEQMRDPRYKVIEP